MVKKFEALYRDFQDLKLFTKKFVPRDEVNEAMQSVLQEVKTVKVNSVSLANFNAALKSKADDNQVQRLITALRGAMGNLEARSSAVGYLRCLICDKPVNSVTTTFDEAALSARERRRASSTGGNNQTNTTPDKKRPHTTSSDGRLLLDAIGTNTTDENRLKNDVKRSSIGGAGPGSQKIRILHKLSDFDDEISTVDGSSSSKFESPSHAVSEVNSLRVAVDLPAIKLSNKVCYFMYFIQVIFA